MCRLRFTWDPEKNKSNTRKHGVSFEEAQSVFLDDHAIEFYDEAHADSEDRFLLLGFSQIGRMLIVCHCYREDESLI